MDWYNVYVVTTSSDDIVNYQAPMALASSLIYMMYGK